MEAQRWFLLALLSFALVATIFYYYTLGKRLVRLKQILDKGPKDEPMPAVSSPTATSAAKTESKAPPRAREGVSIGSLFGKEAQWVEESGIETQRKSATHAPMAAVEPGTTMLDRVGPISPMDLLSKGSSSPAAAEGDLLKKLLSFDHKGGESEAAEPPPHSPPPPPRTERPMDLFKPSPSSREGGGVSRLGAFSSGDAGAPESAKLKPPSILKAPSFSLGGMEGSPPPAPKGTEADEAAKLLAGLQPKGLPSFAELAAARAAQAEADAAEMEASPAMEALSLKSMMGFGKKPPAKVEVVAAPSVEDLLAQELAEKEKQKFAPPPPAGASPSMLGRLGGGEPPRSGGPMGSLMSRLGKPAEGAPAPDPLANLMAAKAPRPTLKVNPDQPLPSRFGAPEANALSPDTDVPIPPRLSGTSVFDKLKPAAPKAPVAPPAPPAPPSRPAPAAKAPLKFGMKSPAASEPKANAFAGLAKLGKSAAAAAGAPAAAKLAGLGAAFKKAAPAAKPAVDVEALERKFIENQEDVDAKRELAGGYLEVGRLDDAIEALTEIIDSDAKQESDIFNLGVAFAKQGNTEGAEMCFLELKHEHKGSPWAGKATAQLLKLKLVKPA